ncbi:hypothetical protein AAK938_01395 [Aerococcaceae bacterium 50-4]
MEIFVFTVIGIIVGALGYEGTERIQRKKKKSEFETWNPYTKTDNYKFEKLEGLYDQLSKKIDDIESGRSYIVLVDDGGVYDVKANLDGTYECIYTDFYPGHQLKKMKMNEAVRVAKEIEGKGAAYGDYEKVYFDFTD